ncbi:MFS general substrate transporter [Pilatotrama ljubarskyi]|nr:MFS general substrate transporter [Pilatotrama ljubarskyi]
MVEKGSLEKGDAEAIVEVPSGELVYGDDRSLQPPPPLTPQEEKRLWRKIDLRTLPILTALYLMASIVRGGIGNAKLQGLTTQLGLTGEKYNVALAMYFVSYTVFTIPSNLVIKKLRPSKWLPGIMLVYGIIATLMGLVKSYSQLVAVRTLLGMAEAGLPPGVFYYITMWYPRHMVQYRIGLFWGGATFAGAFSGLLAFGISFMSGTGGLLGWSWIFVSLSAAVDSVCEIIQLALHIMQIIEGLIGVVIASTAFLVLYDFPDTASFLTPEERSYVVNRLKYDNSSVGEEEHFEWRQLWQTVFDWRVLVCCLINMSVIAPVFGITLFLPSIINGFGFDTVTSQLLSIPPYVLATITVIAWSKWSDALKMRSPFIFAGLVLGLIGFAINDANVSIGAKYFGTFLAVTGSYAGFPGNISWLGNNTVGQYRRAVAIAMQVTFANVGGTIACNIYRDRDAPRYLLGHGIELGFVSMGLVLLPVMVTMYMRANARRDASQRDMQEQGLKIEYTPEDIRKLGDQAPDFRYTL